MNLKNRDSYWNKVSSLLSKQMINRLRNGWKRSLQVMTKMDIVHGKKKIRWNIMIQFV
jgi:hypothetical protein